MLTLIVESEDSRPMTMRIERFPGRIGKHRDNEVVLSSWRVARVHAEIHRIERGFKLIDCGSIGGTWVNGERIVEYGPLDSSDEIVIAGFKLRLEQASESARARRPAAAARGGVTPVADRTAAPQDKQIALASLGAVPATLDLPGQAASLEWRRSMHRKLLHAIDLRRKDVRQLTEGQLRAEAQALLVELLDNEPDVPAQLDRARLIADILDEAIGLGPLERLLSDPDISEIMVNSASEVFVERAGRLERSDIAFTGENAIRAVIDRIVAPLGRRVDESSPMVDARLGDGSRVNAVVPPLAIRGPALTIRRFNRRLLQPEDLLELGTIGRPMLEFLAVCVRTRRNIVISGGTGSGKTTLLNVLSNLIPASERIVTIEDAAELRLCHENLVSLEARPANAEGRGVVTIRDLVRNSLRMRPDRIIVGECRGGEALDMLQAMNTGHDGSLTTLHANSPRDVISRLETMVLMAGVDIPVIAIREQIAAAVDLIVHQARTSDGKRRITEIVELTGVEANRVQMQPIFRVVRNGARQSQGDPIGGEWAFAACGVIPQFYESLKQSGVVLDLAIFAPAGER